MKVTGITHCIVKKVDDEWEMHLTYRYKNFKGDLCELDIPRLVIPGNRMPDINTVYDSPVNNRFYAHFDWDDVILLPGENGEAYSTRLVERHVERLTVKQLEEKLGCTLEIISEEEN